MCVWSFDNTTNFYNSFITKIMNVKYDKKSPTYRERGHWALNYTCTQNYKIMISQNLGLKTLDT